jgi:hypothetical protein
MKFGVNIVSLELLPVRRYCLIYQQHGDLAMWDRNWCYLMVRHHVWYYNRTFKNLQLLFRKLFTE